MVEIIPAIMPKDFEDVKEKASLVVDYVPLVQIDIMDGKFVPSKSWPYDPHDKMFKKLQKKEEGLPHWQELDYELDLMVDEPEAHMDEWRNLGAKRIIFHIEAIKDIDGFLKDPLFSDATEGERSTKLVEVGAAIGIETSNEHLAPYLDNIDFVQFMGIARIGYQGEAFDPRVIEKIKELRAQRSDILISVDGGVNHATAPLLIEAGANRLVSGSQIFSSDNIKEAIGKFYTLTQ